MLSAWLLMTSTSCSRNKTDLQKAQQLESQEKWDDALALYSPLVSRTPAGRASELAELHSYIGHCLIELGRGTDALMALEQAISLDSSNINANLRMGELFVLASAPDRAEPHIEYVAQKLPDDPEMLGIRAAMYAAEDRDDLAEHDFDRALALSKNDDKVPERAAQFYLDENKPEKARSILMESVSHNPRSSGLLLTLARLDETEGETAKAELEYRRAVALDDSVGNNTRLAQFLARNGRIDEAGAILRHADALSRKPPISFADLQLQSGRTREALQSYQSVYENLGKNELADVSTSAKNAGSLALSARLVETNLALASHGDPSAILAARKHLRETAGNLDGDSLSLLRAEISLLSGELANSEEIAKSFVDAPKSKAAAQYLLGEAAARRGRPEQAIDHWQMALNIDSNYVPARIALATEAIQRQNGNEAENWITTVVREEPANVNALLAYARSLLLQRRYESAAALCERARMVDPQNAQIPMLSGQIALGQHQLAIALLEFEKAMLLDPYSESALEGLTAVYEAGNSDEALLRKLENLAQSGTPSSRLMEVAGRLYAWKGEYPDAVRCLRRAVQMDPYRKTAKVALARVYVDQQPNASAQELLTKPELQSLRQEKEFPLVAAAGAESRGDQAEAMREYEAAVEAGDPSGIASNNLAWMYAMQGKHLDRALKLAQQALEANPDSPQVLDTLGMIQLQNRKFSEAVALFQRAIRRASELKGMDSVQRTIEAHLSQALQVSGIRTSS